MRTSDRLSGCGALDNHEDVFSGNTVVMTSNSVGGPQCHAPGKTIVGHNSYYTPTGTVQECGSDLAEWQKKDPAHTEVGSTVAKTPTDAEIIGWAKTKLNIM